MKRALFIDRDGTLIKEPADEQIDQLDKFELLPGMLSNLKRIAESGQFELVMVTNQDGLGTDSFPEATFWPLQNLLIRLLESEGIRFSDVLIDRTFPEQKALTRKPKTGMLYRYLQGGYDLANSYVIGDRLSDVELAKNMGCKAIYITETSSGTTKYEEVGTWSEILDLLREEGRVATVLRQTAETSIRGQLNLDQTTGTSINTGLPFFDHMLDQIARHAKISLQLDVQGDLEIDAHHTIEDVGIALGGMIKEALGSKIGISRYGFALPMDEARAEVLMDLGGRYSFSWKVSADENEAGTIPMSLWKHFFDAMAQHLSCNLQINAAGENAHHVIESVFKGFARALRMANSTDGTEVLPTTKSFLA